jgi:hypothetical protein
MSQQIVYVAIGSQYLAWALRSAAQAQAGGFAGGIVIVTDQPDPGANTPGSLPNTTFAAVPTPAGELPFAAFEYKARFLDFATADQVLFLDCDTLVAGDVTPVFTALGAGGVSPSVAMAAEIYPNAAACFSGQPDFQITQAAGLDQVPFWNCGVIAIANDVPGQALVAAWHAEWARFPNAWDEMAMLRALKSTSTAPATLDPRYDDQAPLGQKTGIIRHYVGGQKLTAEFLGV